MTQLFGRGKDLCGNLTDCRDVGAPGNNGIKLFVGLPLAAKVGSVVTFKEERDEGIATSLATFLGNAVGSTSRKLGIVPATAVPGP